MYIFALLFILYLQPVILDKDLYTFIQYFDFSNMNYFGARCTFTHGHVLWIKSKEFKVYVRKMHAVLAYTSMILSGMMYY